MAGDDRDAGHRGRAGGGERDSIGVEIAGAGRDGLPGARGARGGLRLGIGSRGCHSGACRELHGQRLGPGLRGKRGLRDRPVRWNGGSLSTGRRCSRLGRGRRRGGVAGLHEAGDDLAFPYFDLDPGRIDPAADVRLANRGDGFDPLLQAPRVDQVERFAGPGRHLGSDLGLVHQDRPAHVETAVPAPLGGRPGSGQHAGGGQSVEDGPDLQASPTTNPRPRTSGRSSTPCLSYTLARTS